MLLGISKFRENRRRDCHTILYGYKYNHRYTCTVKQHDILTVNSAMVKCCVTGCAICCLVKC